MRVLGSAVFQATAYVVVYGGAVSWYRVHGAGVDGGTLPGDPDVHIQCAARRAGERMLPFVALSAGYQNVKSDVNAARTRLESGYGPAALSVDWTHYKEDDPVAELDLLQVYGLYRMSFTQYVELDLGAGTMNLSGDGGQFGGSMTTPVKVQFIPALGMTFRPAWGWLENTVSDYGLVLSASLRYVSIEGGYRWLRSGNASLDGPVVDVSFHM
jgi:hypothetical protein